MKKFQLTSQGISLEKIEIDPLHVRLANVNSLPELISSESISREENSILDNGVADSSITPGVSSNASSFKNSILRTTGEVNTEEGRTFDPVGILAGAAG